MRKDFSVEYGNGNHSRSELNPNPETALDEGDTGQGKSDEVFSDLRQVLLDLIPAGSNGFEGLIAAALAACTNLTFRLAKSGSQFGRDASSSPGSFAIAMEAKRYRESPSLETIVSKGLLAADFLDGAIDLWVLGCTAPVGDDVFLRLKEELDDRGISLLVLDWSPYPLPPLGVLLATARDATLEWVALHQPDARKTISLELSKICASAGYEAAKAKLLLDVSSSQLGLDAAKARNRDWLVERFNDPGKAQLAFGQYLSVLDSTKPAVVRESLLGELDAWLGAEKSEDIAVLLGPEGVGKSWLIAYWWAQLLHPPIFLIAAGYISRSSWIPNDPELFIAQLLAKQTKEPDEMRIASWRRRLRRWKTQGGAGFRFLVLLDGLNESSDKPWADLIKSLAGYLSPLGGKLAVTSRTEFWRRDVAAKLRGNLKWLEIAVSGYSDGELKDALAGTVDPKDLLISVKELIRNPRVCALAKHLFARAKLTPFEVTVPRLFFEYWCHRLEERGDLLGHNTDDFEELLRSHARRLRNTQTRMFNRNDWRAHSAPSRRGSQSFMDDLTEIEEGRFLRPVAGVRAHYEFREEALPFALGLLTAREIQDEWGKSNTDPNETIARILEEVQGFDLTADIMAAAVAVSCLDPDYPPQLRPVLIVSWLELQNVPDAAFQELCAYVPDCPEAFLDSGEILCTRNSARRSGWLEEALVIAGRHPSTAQAINSRVRSWLGRWSRVPRHRFHADPNGVEQVRKGAERIRVAHQLLTAHERAVFDKLCTEVAHRDDMDVDSLGFKLLAGKPLESFVDSLLAWSLATEIIADSRSAFDEGAWLLRLNVIDPTETEQAVLKAARSVLASEASITAKEAVVMLLRMVGTEETT